MTTTLRLWQADPAPLQTLASWGTAEAPPKEFLIFRYGANHATIAGKRQMVFLTEKNAHKIVSEWKRRNISGAFDYEHAVMEKHAEGTPAAGWFSIEARADGLWAVGVTWTDRAQKYFAGKEYRYFSPLFMTDHRNNIVLLQNIALTNWPATDQQRPLIALSARARRHSSMETSLTLEQLQAKAQELVDTFGAKGDLLEIAKWLDALLRGGMSAAPLDGEEVVIDEALTATPSDELTAVANAAFAFTNARSLQGVKGAFLAYSEIKRERDLVAKKLSALEHKTAVEDAIVSKRLVPGMREKALSMQPEFFKQYISLAPVVVDDETLTANTATTAQGKTPTVEELQKNENFMGWCQRFNQDPKSYAESYVKTGQPWVNI